MGVSYGFPELKDAVLTFWKLCTIISSSNFSMGVAFNIEVCSKSMVLEISSCAWQAAARPPFPALIYWKWGHQKGDINLRVVWPQRLEMLRPERSERSESSEVMELIWNLLEYRGTPRPSLPSRSGHRSWMFGLTLPLQNNELPMKHDFHWHNTVVLMLFRCVFCLWLFHLSQFEKLWQLWVSNGCRKGPVCRTSSRQADPQQSWFSQSLPVPFPIYFPNQAKLAQTTDYWFPFGVSSQKFLASQDRQEIQPNTPLELQNPWQLRQEAQTVRRTSDKSFWQEPLLDLHATSEKISQDTHRRTF